MKSIIIIAIIVFGVINSKYLKNEQADVVVQKSVDPKSVKSLGEFSNISPDATKVITPKYANPKLQVVMNVEKFRDRVQRMEFQGNTVSPNTAVTQDVAGFAFDKGGFARQEVPGVSKKMILTQTTEPMKTNTIHPVMLDLNVDKNANGVAANPKVLPAPNKYTAPKSGGDIQITKYEDKVVEDPISQQSNRK